MIRLFYVDNEVDEMVSDCLSGFVLSTSAMYMAAVLDFECRGSEICVLDKLLKKRSNRSSGDTKIWTTGWPSRTWRVPSMSCRRRIVGDIYTALARGV